MTRAKTKKAPRRAVAIEGWHGPDVLRPLLVRCDHLTIDPANARRHPERNLATIKASLARFGQQKPIVAQAIGGVVIAGNGTLTAARDLGWSHVACVFSKLEGSAARAFAVADNRSAELAEWDDVVLADLLKSLADDERLALGFDDDDLAEIVDRAAGDADIEGADDEAPAPPATPTSKLGDLWLLGGHRLLCGDSTKADDVQRLMNGERAGLMNTDPPYGVAYANDERPHRGRKPKPKPRVTNDTLCDEDLQRFLEAAFRVAVVEALEERAAWYLWHAHLTQGFFAATAAAAANVVLHRQIIWVKPVLLLGRGQYHWKHEPCFMGWVKGKQPPDYGRGAGERDQTTVWELDGVGVAERAELNHSTPKPVALFEVPITKHLRTGRICFEPFSGSGPQLIAAEKLRRRCFALEITPAFVDVGVLRWQKVTGKQATLDGDGRTFEAIAADRA